MNLRWATPSEQHNNKSKKSTNSSKREVCQFTLEGQLIKVWDSVTSVAKGIKHETHVLSDYVWRYYDEVIGSLPEEFWKDYIISIKRSCENSGIRDGDIF